MNYASKSFLSCIATTLLFLISIPLFSQGVVVKKITPFTQDTSYLSIQKGWDKINIVRINVGADYFHIAKYKWPQLNAELSYGKYMSADYYYQYSSNDETRNRQGYIAVPVLKDFGISRYHEYGIAARLYPADQNNFFNKPSTGFYYRFGLFQYIYSQRLYAAYQYYDVDSARMEYQSVTYKYKLRSPIGVQLGAGLKTYHTKWLYTDIMFTTQRCNPNKFFATVNRLGTRPPATPQVAADIDYDMNLLHNIAIGMGENGQTRIEARIGINLDRL